MFRRALLVALVAALFAPAAASATPILGLPLVPPEQAAVWARMHGATPLFVSLAGLYWEVGEKLGVRPEVAYAQAAKETDFGRFTGVLNARFHNPAGLKRPQGGPNRNPSAHMRFSSWREGITAQFEHLALYAGKPGYPKAGAVDPRPFASLAGRAKTVEALGGSWAPSKAYGRSLARLVRMLDLVT